MRFAVLGPTEVWDGDRAVELGPARRRLVLAALLVDAGRVVSTDVLLDRVWDGTPPAAAPASLQAYVSRLRATLATAVDSQPTTLKTSPRGYSLQVERDDVDAFRFADLVTEATRLRENDDLRGARQAVGNALALWRGPAYADFTAQFLSAESSRLDELRFAAHELSAALDLDLGRHDDVIREVTPLVTAEPLREPLREALILALYRAGRQADALAVFAAGRGLLADELGIDPRPAGQELYERILRQDPSLDHTPATSTEGRLTVSLEPGRDRLIGRERELTLLGDSFRRAAAGRTQVVAVVGEAGIGKSRLTEEATSHLRASGTPVAWARCWQHEGAPQYWPWIQVLRDLAGQLPAAVLARAITGAGGGVDILVPELRPSDAAEQRGFLGPEQAEAQLFDGVLAFLTESAAHRPVIVVIDDLQWADAASRRLHEYLAWRAKDLALSLVATVRSPGHDPSYADLDVLTGLARQTNVTRCDLQPLTADDVLQFVADRLGSGFDAQSAERLHARTGGNPFFVEEIVRLVATTGVEQAVAEGIPDTVRGVIHRRVMQLSETDLNVLRSAAVVGRTFAIDLLATVTGLGEDDVDEAIDRATAIGVLQSEPHTVDQHRFTHAILQQTLLDETGPSRRARLHRRIAATLVERRAAAPASPAEQIAFHFVGAGGEADLARAVEWFLKAEDEALERGAFSECPALLADAEAAAARLNGPSAQAHRDAALVRRQWFEMVFRGATWVTDRGDVAIPADADLEVLSDRDLLSLLQVTWGALQGGNALYASLEASERTARFGRERDDVALRVAALMSHGHTLQQLGRWTEAADDFAAIAPLANGSRFPVLEFLPTPTVGGPLWESACRTVLGQHERADALFAHALDQAMRTGDAIALAFVRSVDIHRAVWRHDWPAAAQAAVAVTANREAQQLATMKFFTALPLAWSRAQDDPAAGLALADEAMQVLDPPESLAWRQWFRGMYAAVALRAGRPEQALRSVDLALAEAATSGGVGYDPELRRIRAETLHALGADRAGVEFELDTGLVIAAEQDAHLFTGHLRRARQRLLRDTPSPIS